MAGKYRKRKQGEPVYCRWSAHKTESGRYPDGRQYSVCVYCGQRWETPPKENPVETRDPWVE